MCSPYVRWVRQPLRVAALTTFLAAIGASGLLAQAGQITGTVTNADTGEPVVAAQISVVGTTLGITTGGNGSYTIAGVPAGTYTLQIQRIGYLEFQQPGVTVTAGQATVQNLTMAVQPLQLNAIVATGLIDPVEGVRSPITIGRLDRQNMPVPVAGSAIQNLQGQIAGVTIARGSGEPGAAAAIQLRSPTSIGAGTPLIVVDGVILGGTSADLESMDILSIEVVKGAAAASLYGSRAANGVIAITTNRGSGLAFGTTQMTARSEFGWQSAIEGLRLPTHHFYALTADGMSYADADGNAVGRGDRIQETGNQFRLFMDNPYPGPIYDNINEVWNPGSQQQHTVNLAQNTTDTNFFLSLNRNVQQGALPNNDGYSRNSFRINLDHRFLNSLSLGISAFHARTYSDDVNGSLNGL
ncbi:MAG: carboxypeptidase regulatory-like domain-containing protein [Gemmatimonadota bacterium]